jgi:hypothetical protein
VTETADVVAHFLDGRVIRGTTQDFFPNRPAFHVNQVDNEAATLKITVKELKAVFFVRDLHGNPTRQDLRGFLASPQETPLGRKIAVRFADGELVCGYSIAYSPQREGFFISPADGYSNNERIYVVASNAYEVREGREAEELAKRVLSSQAA